MTFNLLNAQPFTLKGGGASNNTASVFKIAMVTVSKLTKVGAPGEAEDFEDVFLTKLENSLVRQAGPKRPRLDDILTLDRQIKIEVFVGAVDDDDPTVNGFLRLHTDKENGLFGKFAVVCGGDVNIYADLAMEFGTSNEAMMKLDFKDLELDFDNDKGTYEIKEYFKFAEPFAQKWNVQANFLGKVTLNFKLNSEALNLIHLDNLEEPAFGLNRKLLKTAASSGDTIIVAKNGRKVRCHKMFLTVQNTVFQAMFNSDMKEGKLSTIIMDDMSEWGVRALLDYLYCRNIEGALGYCGTALGLLIAGDKYQIDDLVDSMKEVIMHKDNDWFSITTTLNLWLFAKKKVDNGEAFKEILEKAMVVLKSKAPEKVVQCSMFKEMVRTPEIAQEMLVYFIFKK